MANKNDIGKAEPQHERLVALTASAICYAVGVISGVFLIAMGGIFVPPEWLTSGELLDSIVAATAVLAAVTGAIGVLFVAKTLNAAINTLESQVGMAKEQEKANRLEYQARLTFETLSIELGENKLIEFAIGIKNYGKTEAKNIFLFITDEDANTEPNKDNLRAMRGFANIETGKVETETILIKVKKGRPNIPKVVTFWLSFINYDGRRVKVEEIPIEITTDDDVNYSYIRKAPKSLREEFGI